MYPGKPPSWGPGGKSAVGTSAGPYSLVWFTMAQGCITETYFPRPDCANTRTMFLVVTEDHGFFSDERLHASHSTRMVEPGVPLYETENRCNAGRYRILKTTLTDPSRNVLIQRIRFDPVNT